MYASAKILHRGLADRGVERLDVSPMAADIRAKAAPIAASPTWLDVPRRPRAVGPGGGTSGLSVPSELAQGADGCNGTFDRVC
jgi:hypothetical protein